MLNVVETSTKTYSLCRFCLSTLGGFCPGGILSYGKSSYFRGGILSGGDFVRGGFCPGGIMSGIRRKMTPLGNSRFAKDLFERSFFCRQKAHDFNINFADNYLQVQT